MGSKPVTSTGHLCYHIGEEWSKNEANPMEDSEVVDRGLFLMVLIEHLDLACSEPDPPKTFQVHELIDSLSLFKAA